VSDQLLLGVRLRDSSVFASYFAGPNGAVVDVLRGLAPGVLPPCVYVQGSRSTGKSHLLQAVCAEAANRGLTAAYLPLNEISRIGPEMLSGWGELDIVCVDDIERVAAERDWNRELFALHQQLEERRGRLVVASTLAPAALRMTLRDLASRLAGGYVLTLQPLGDAEQMSALKLHAQLRGFELPDETAAFMLRRLPRDMGTLCRFLAELDDASLVAQRRLTVRFVMEVMKRREGEGG
jgi:DnaA family protein